MSKRTGGREIPAPATQSDMYNAAIVEELERLNDSIERLIGLVNPPTALEADASVSSNAETELKEPAPKAKPTHRDAKRDNSA